jgi:hypothetical protein
MGLFGGDEFSQLVWTLFALISREQLFWVKYSQLEGSCHSSSPPCQDFEYIILFSPGL